MAKAASKDAVASAMKPPEYRNAIKRLSSIEALKAKQSQGAKKIDDIYNAAETLCGVSKVASKFFIAIQKLDDADKLRIFRDINGLLEASGTPTTGSDLVDDAQDKVVQMRMPAGDDDANEQDAEDAVDEIAEEVDALDDEEDDEGDEPGDGAEAANDFDEASEEELAAQKPRSEMQEAREATSSGDAPSAGAMAAAQTGLKSSPIQNPKPAPPIDGSVH